MPRRKGSGYFRTKEDGYTILEIRYRHRTYKIRWARVVLEKKLGRPLLATESVHHINGDRSDDRPENLQLVLRQHPKGQRYQCRACGSYDVRPAEF